MYILDSVSYFQTIDKITSYNHSLVQIFVHGIVQFSLVSVMSDSLRPHEPQHARPPWPSPTPKVHPNPCPLSWWCHPTISSSVIPFSSCPQSFPASGSFQMSQLFSSGGQSTGVSASACPSNEHPGLIYYATLNLNTKGENIF